MKGEVEVFGTLTDRLVDGRGGAEGLVGSVEQRRRVDQAQHVCSSYSIISHIADFRTV
jgi:hypothetical protein